MYQQMDQPQIPEFINIINGMPPDKEEKTYLPTLENLSIAVFYQHMNNLSALDEKDRYNFIKSNIDLISNQILDGTCRYLKKLLEPVFLRVYKEVLTNMPYMINRTMAANKLAYSYRYMKNQDTGTARIFMEIARIANSHKIQMLKSIGLPEDIACNLCIARFSSPDEMVNVNRLNYEIYINGSQLMTEQMIIWIYEQLFDQMRYLFSATMMETKETMKPAPDSSISEEDYYEAFSQTSLALLTIVNNMPMESIDALLRIFLDNWTTVGRPITRFSLRALSGDFGRIRHVVETMEIKEKIYMP